MNKLLEMCGGGGGDEIKAGGKQAEPNTSNGSQRRLLGATVGCQLGVSHRGLRMPVVLGERVRFVYGDEAALKKEVGAH